MITKVVLAGKTIELVALELIINEFAWEAYSKLTGNEPTADLNIQDYYGNGLFNGGSLNNMLSKLIERVITTTISNGSFKPSTIETVHKTVWDINTRVFNLCYDELLEYLTSMDILDMLEVQNHSKLKAAMAVVKKELTVISIEQAYVVLEDILAHDKSLRNNPVSKAYLGKAINNKQLRQVLGPIGYRTDINSLIFKTPISNSFVEGLGNLYDFCIESRSAARALFFSKEAISKSETFAKHLHLLMMPISHIVFTDCGNTKLREMLIRPMDHPSLTPGSRGDLYGMVGKYYKLSPKDKTFKTIKLTDIHLLGKVIYFRTGDECTLKNPHHVCAACFGELATNIPVKSNIGHYSANALMKPASQTILSIKHLISSATAADAIIDGITKKIMSVSGPKYKLEADLLRNFDKVVIKFKKDEAFVIKDIRTENDLNKINPDRASSIRSISMELTKGEVVIKHSFEVGNVHRTGRLTSRFFKFLLVNGYTLDKRGNYTVDVTKWKLKSPFLILPEVEFSYFTLFLAIQDMVKTRAVLKGGTSADTPATLALKLFDLINSKLDVNMAYIEMIVYSLTCKDLPNGNYALGRNVDNPQLGSLVSILVARGMGALTAFGLISSRATNPIIFQAKSKVTHPLDVLIKPVETLNSMDNLTRYGHPTLVEEKLW